MRRGLAICHIPSRPIFHEYHEFHECSDPPVPEPFVLIRAIRGSTFRLHRIGPLPHRSGKARERSVPLSPETGDRNVPAPFLAPRDKTQTLPATSAGARPAVRFFHDHIGMQTPPHRTTPRRGLEQRPFRMIRIQRQHHFQLQPRNAPRRLGCHDLPYRRRGTGQLNPLPLRHNPHRCEHTTRQRRPYQIGRRKALAFPHVVHRSIGLDGRLTRPVHRPATQGTFVSNDSFNHAAV